MLTKHCLLAAILVLFISPLVNAKLREWTSSDGKFKIKAELVRSDAASVTLLRTDGQEVTVPLDKLSAADRKFLAEAARPAAAPAGLPDAVVKFKAAMEAMRAVETARLKKRLEELKEHLHSGAKENKHPVAQEAKALQKALVQRLRLIEAGEPFIPRLSPKDFQVGQIGEFDDDLKFLPQTIEKDGSAYVGIVFDEIRHREKLARDIVIWHHTTISRPDRIHLRAPFAAALPVGQHDFDRDSPANRAIRPHVYEVIDKEPRGLISDFALTTFKMDEVRAWFQSQRAEVVK